MKYNIVFSLPVHEKFDVILDQLYNIKTLNNECAVIIHLSPSFDKKSSLLSREKFEKILSEEFATFAYINPTSVRTGWFDIIQAHICNYDYAKNSLDFEYFAPIASNELFVKSGLYDYIKSYDCGIGYKEYKRSSSHRGSRLAFKDKSFESIRKELNYDKVIWSQIEGTFYKAEIFGMICEIVKRNYDYNEVQEFYEREEMYLPTILWGKYESLIKILKNQYYTYVPWGRSTLTTRLQEAIEFSNNPQSHYFSIKRVQRDNADFVRTYFRQLYRYDDKLKQYVPSIENVDYDKLLKLERYDYLKKSLLRRWHVIKYYFTNFKDIAAIFKQKYLE